MKNISVGKKVEASNSGRRWDKITRMNIYMFEIAKEKFHIFKLQISIMISRVQQYSKFKNYMLIFKA